MPAKHVLVIRLANDASPRRAQRPNLLGTNQVHNVKSCQPIPKPSSYPSQETLLRVAIRRSRSSSLLADPEGVFGCGHDDTRGRRAGVVATDGIESKHHHRPVETKHREDWQVGDAHLDHALTAVVCVEAEGELHLAHPHRLARGAGDDVVRQSHARIVAIDARRFERCPVAHGRA
eukprot:6185002-Pleurochrysis_carterae.AAC.3